jgi:hypothetical protein
MAPKKDLRHTEYRYTKKYAAQHNETAVKCLRIIGKAVAASIVAALKLLGSILRLIFFIISIPF